MLAVGLTDWLCRRWPGLVIGAAVTAGICIVELRSGLQRLDNAILDWHFRHFLSVSADGRITLIDIDDRSLATVGEWPWPRRRHAEIVRTLHELGAGSIVLDVLFAEPTPPRLTANVLHRHYGVDESAATDQPPVSGIGPNAADIVYDDDELAAAIRGAGNVVLAAYADPADRIAVDAVALAAQSRLRTEVWNFLQQYPGGSWPQFFAVARPDDELEVITPEREDLLGAYRWARATRAVLAKAGRKESESSGQPAGPDLRAPLELEPPLDKLAEAAASIGMVGFERERTRGVVREAVLQSDVAGRVIPQLALAGVEQLTAGDSAAHRSDIPQGSTLIHWHVPISGRWQDSFRHIPAARVLEIADLRTAMAENSRRYAVALGELIKARHAGTPAEFDAYARKVNEGSAITQDLAHSGSSDMPKVRRRAMLDRLAELDDSIQESHQEAFQWLGHAAGLWADEQPQDQEERIERDRILRLQKRFAPNGVKDEIAKRNARLEESANDLLNELRPQVAGRLCIVGYTATAAGELVASPVFDSMPGVMVHANAANTLLYGRFPTRASLPLNLLWIAAFGSLMTVAGNVRGWQVGLLALLTLGALILVLGAWQFRVHGLHMAGAGAAVAVGGVWAAVTLVRQSTEERVRRRLQKALTQYVSSEIAGHIANLVRPRDLAPQAATVTCFFCDLSEFTRLSERLGPAATRRVLNPYLESVSRVLIARGAVVNKFIGDGVFAFFNAPIRPCPDHARRACAAALEVVDAVVALNRDLKAENGGALGLLRVRVGLTTGEVFVGDYGSEAKLDYTCIGDAVNVAARLEKANKAFGTRVLIDDATRQATGDEFVCRSLGRLELAGKSQVVTAHELLSAEPSASQPDKAFIAAFDKMLGHYQRCEWNACREAIAECDRLRSEDAALERYRLAMLIASSGPNPLMWSGAVSIGAS